MKSFMPNGLFDQILSRNVLQYQKFPKSWRHQWNFEIFLNHVIALITKILCAKFHAKRFIRWNIIAKCSPVPKIPQIVTSSMKFRNIFTSHDSFNNRDPLCKVSCNSVYSIKNYREMFSSTKSSLNRDVIKEISKYFYITW